MSASPRAQTTGLASILILLGVLSITFPVITSLSLGAVLGVVLLVSGLIQGAHELTTRQSPLGPAARIARLLMSILSIVAGILVLHNPVTGAEGLTVVLTLYFLTSGIGKGVLSQEARHVTSSGWLLLSAMASLLMAFFLIATFPASSLWVPGIFFGLDLLLYGLALIALSRAHAGHEIQEQLKPPRDHKAA